MSSSEIIKRIKRYYFFYGPNEHHLNQRISSLIRTVISPGGQAFDLDRFDGRSCNVIDVINSLSMPPAISPLRVVIVADVGKLHEKALDRLESFLPRIPEYSVLVMTAVKVDARRRFFRARLADKAKHTHRFDEYKHEELAAMVIKFAQAREKKVTADLAETLIGLYGPDPYRLENEVEKLSLYLDQREQAERADLAFVTGFRRVETAYDLPELTLTGRIREALELAIQGMASGINEMQILYLFKNFAQALNVAAMSTEVKEVMSRARVGYPTAVRAIRLSKKIGQRAILRILTCLFRAEYSLKSARFPPKTVIELLILSIYLAASGNKRDL